MKESPRIDRQAALLRAARSDLDAARALRWPQVDLFAGYSRRSHVPELTMQMPDGQRRALFPDLPDNYRARAGLSLPLFTGGRIGGLTGAARAEADAASSDLSTHRLDVAFEAREAYWALVTARETVRVLNEALEAYEAHLEDARNRERFGMAARNDVLALEVERDRAELTLIRARSGVEVAQASLARLAGLAPGTRIETVEPLDLDPESAPIAEEEALVTQALADRPERNALLGRVAASRARANAARAAYFPQVAVIGGYDYSNPNRNIMPPDASWKDSWDVGISVSMKAFDGGKTAASVARARAQSDALEAGLADLDGLIRLQITAKRLAVASSLQAMRVSERRLESARENRRVAADRYREGLIASSDLLDAEVAFLRAGLDRTEAFADARLAIAALDRAVGK
ncbi:MAG: TolC family protein [Vicinamibacteria bacterium]|nr:TolC family protein [Vicinamibacteria bacterium]